jgi:hypothetical protein
MMFRSLVCFEVERDDYWYVCVPGWGLQALIGVITTDLPDFIRENIQPGFRCYAKINLGEEDPLNVRFENWELPCN